MVCGQWGKARLRAVVVLVVSACGGSPSTSHVPQPAPSIAVLEAGAVPRQRLRYELTPHVAVREELGLKLRIRTAFTNTVLETGHRIADFPTATIVARVEVTAVTPAGDALVTSVVEGTTVHDDVVDPAIHKAFEAEITAMKGWRASWRMSPGGALSEPTVETKNATRAARERMSNLSDSIRAASVVFPDAEIGVGATWRVAEHRIASGVTWERTVTYHLRGLSGTTATVVAEVVMRAPAQALSVEPNATTTLTSGTANETAELTVPLRGLVATGTSRETSEANFSLVRGHLRITSTVQTESLYSVKPLGPTPPNP